MFGKNQKWKEILKKEPEDSGFGEDDELKINCFQKIKILDFTKIATKGASTTP